MFERFATRSRKLERLDTGEYTPAEYAKWQREMRLVHGFLGEIRALRNSLFRDINGDGSRSVSILDVGAGSGELLRHVGMQLGNGAFLVGAELNADAAVAITGKGLTAVRCDGLRLPFADCSFDYVYCSLITHHLGDAEAIEFLSEMSRVARKRIFVIDLHRSPIAYYFYRLASPFLFQRFTQEDGALSILRSFKPGELRELGERAGLKDISIERSAAYRLVLSGN